MERLSGNIKDSGEVLRGVLKAADVVYEADYNLLHNKPSINGIKLEGDKSWNELGLDLSDYYTKVETTEQIANEIDTYDDIVKSYLVAYETKSEFAEEIAKYYTKSEVEEIRREIIGDIPYIPWYCKAVDFSETIDEEMGTNTESFKFTFEEPYAGGEILSYLYDFVVPKSLKAMADDETHRTVTDEQIASWDSKSEFSGDYEDLENKPNIPDSIVNNAYLVDKSHGGSSTYSFFVRTNGELKEYPVPYPKVPTKLSELQSDTEHQTVSVGEKMGWNYKVNLTQLEEVENKIPTQLSQLTGDETHRTVSDEQIAKWDDGGDVIADNLMPVPYYTASGETNGVTYTVNDDGSIGISGTATANSSFYLCGWTNVGQANRRIKLDSDKTYTLKCCPQGGSNTTYRLAAAAYLDDNTTIKERLYDTGDGVTFSGASFIALAFAVYAGNTVDFTIYPMLEEGDTAHAYQPYKLSRQCLRNDIDSGGGSGGGGIEIIHSLPSSPVADKIYYYPDSDVGASLFAFTDNRWRYVTMGIYGQSYFYNAAYIKQNAVLIGDTPQEAVQLINRAVSIGDRVFAEACTIAGLNQPNANNRFNIRINCEYATYINFYVGCAGEGGNYDYMEIYVDDEKVSDVKPDTSRKEIPQKVTAYLSSGGYHTIGFRYKSDGSSFYEEDSGFVYGIEFVG